MLKAQHGKSLGFVAGSKPRIHVSKGLSLWIVDYLFRPKSSREPIPDRLGSLFVFVSLGLLAFCSIGNIVSDDRELAIPLALDSCNPLARIRSTG
jgi:hypothetical protein